MSDARIETTEKKRRSEQEATKVPAKKQKGPEQEFEACTEVINHSYRVNTPTGLEERHVRCTTARHIETGALVNVVCAADVQTLMGRRKNNIARDLKSLQLSSFEAIYMWMPSNRSAGYCVNAAGFEKLLRRIAKKPHNSYYIAWLNNEIKPFLNSITLHMHNAVADNSANVSASFNHSTTRTMKLLAQGMSVVPEAKSVLPSVASTSAHVLQVAAEVSALQPSIIITPIPMPVYPNRMLFSLLPQHSDANGIRHDQPLFPIPARILK
jgi:hypothetical protein